MISGPPAGINDRVIWQRKKPPAPLRPPPRLPNLHWRV